ncbi:Uncharacterised protein [Enterobacter cloacae]|nr:Uncharacterised protein [Enterobacter cloacae]
MYGLFSFLLVSRQPFNPLSARCTVIFNPCLLQCISMSLAVLQAMKGRRFLHRDIQQANQLACLNF